MQLSETIRFAGDVNIDKLEIVSSNGFGQNVVNQVIGIEIYEDLFAPFITGLIVLKDSLDLTNLFPFTGEEYINLRVRTPTYTEKETFIDSSFYIFKMANRELVGDKSVAYELHFISFEAIVDLNKKLSSSYSGKISDIAKSLITDKHNGLETSKPFLIEETPNSVKYVSNFWSPVKNLNYIAGNAVNFNGTANYLFFENRSGLNFVSMENLYSQKTKQSFIYDSFYREFAADGRAIRNVEEEYKRIIDVSVPESFDYIENSRGGMYSSKMVTYDITTKRYTSRNFSMLETFEKEKHLNKNPLASKKNITKFNSLIINYPKYYGNFSGYGDVTNAKTIQKRISSLKQSEGNRIQITVPGRTDYTVGMKINLTLYKLNPTTKDDNDIIDNVFSGNYLIAAVNHHISREKHECYMELIKDSYIINLDNGGV